MNEIHALSTTTCNVNIAKGTFAEQDAGSDEMHVLCITTFHVVKMVQTKPHTPSIMCNLMKQVLARNDVDLVKKALPETVSTSRSRIWPETVSTS
jgi:hypothetical protein